MKQDMLGKHCLYCKKGKYMVKPSSYFDIDRLVCPKCFHDISRFKYSYEIKEFKKRIKGL